MHHVKKRKQNQRKKETKERKERAEIENKCVERTKRMKQKMDRRRASNANATTEL